jgi:hypothetical protein
VGLDLEPDAEAGLRLPDGGHFGARITRDHRGTSALGGLGGRPRARGGRRHAVGISRGGARAQRGRGILGGTYNSIAL